MLKNVDITKKVPLIMITFALLSALVTGVTAYIKITESMEHSTRDKLDSLLASRKSSLQHYFNNAIRQLSYQAKSPLIINAVRDFEHAWNNLQQPQETFLQQQYIHSNPYLKEEQYLLNAAADNSNYTQIHRKNHPHMSNIIDINAYYDLFLITAKGDLVYSVAKESDYATNLLQGRWKDTGIADLFKRINNSKTRDKVFISDFAPYPPSNFESASFMGTSIYQDNQYLGVLIVQLPIEPLDNIMQVTAGMGRTGETYIVGEERLLRSNSRFFSQRSILKTEVDTVSAQQALNGNSGFSIIKDYRNISVYSAYTPISILSYRWAMMAEIDEAEVQEPIQQMSNYLLLSGLLIAAVISVLGYLISRDISHPIVSMTQVMKKLSNNDLSVNIQEQIRGDEIGKMADAMRVFKQNAIEREDLKTALVKIVHIDSLTGLYNRKYAMEQLSQLTVGADTRAYKTVLMFIDLDNFKQMNDIYAHQEGDKTLCSMADHLKACVRKDDIIARIGGDEFIIILPAVTDAEQVYPIAQALLNNLPKCKVEITLSIGLSVYPDDATDPHVLLRQADSAMYNVKRSGKNQFAHWDNSRHC